MNVPSLYLIHFTRMAHESPLDALRVLKLAPAQLEGLAVILDAVGEDGLAAMFRAEAALQDTLEEIRSKCLTLN